jgi:ribosome-associated translation inhibitor RaiA
MKSVMDVTFRDMEASPAVQAAITEWVEKLEHLEPRLQRCAVVIERPHQKHRHGQIFHVRIELAIADRHIVVSHEPEHDKSHENVYAAISDAFRAAKRQLHDKTRPELTVV